MKKFLWIVGGFLILIVFLALIVPFFVDVNSYKGLIASKVKEATGRDIVIEGNLSLSILAGPAISADQIRLANAQGGSDVNMIVLEALKIHLALAPLLSGEIEITDITLEKPVILLEKLANGKGNWEFGPDRSTKAPPRETETATGESSDLDLRINSITVEDGTLIYRDITAKTEQRVEKINIEASLDSLKGPYQLDGGLTYQGQPISLQVKSGKMTDKSFPLDATIGTEAGDTKIIYAGNLTLSPISFEGNITVGSDNLAQFLSGVTGEAPSSNILAKEFHLNSKIKGSDTQAQISETNMQLGDIDAKIAATIAYGASPIGIGIRINANQLDLDTLLSDETLQSDASEGSSKAISAPAHFSLPTGLAVNALVEIEQIVFQKQVIGQFQAKATLANERLNLENVSAMLPGNGIAKISGILSAQQNQPAFAGALDIKSDNFRALLKAFSVTLDNIPQDRLRRFNMSGAINYVGNQININKMNGQLDGSRLGGGANILLPKGAQKLGMGVTINIDKMNVDAYLPKSEKQSASADTKEEKNDPLASLAPLAGMNVNVDLSAGSLILQEQQIDNLRIQAGVQGNSLIIKNASVGRFLGGDGKVSGKVDNINASPIFELNFDIGANDGGALLAMAGQDRAIGQALGAIRASGTAKGTSQSIIYDSKLAMSNVAGNGTAKGTIKGLDSQLTTNNIIAVSLAKPAPLLQSLKMAGAQANNIGAISMEGAIDTSPDEIMVNITLAGLNGQTAVKGNISKGNFDASLNANYPEFATLLRALDLPAGVNATGPLQAKAQIKGNKDQAAIDDLDVKWGSSNLTGTVNYTQNGDRTIIGADLTGGIIDLSPFMANNQAKSTKPSAQGNARWSKEPFDFSAIQKMDGDISFEAKELVLPDQRFTDFNFKGNLKNGNLTLQQLNGGLYGGRFDLSGTVVTFTANNLKLDTQVKLDQLMIGEIMKGGMGGMQVRGPLSANLQASGQGNNQEALVQNLNGQGDFNGQVTLLGQLETALGSTLLNVLGQKVKQLRSVTENLNSALTSFTGTANEGSGTFVIRNGIVDTRDTKFANPRAYGTAQGQVNLAAWVMDMLVNLHQGNNAQPFISVNLNGPLNAPKTSIVQGAGGSETQAPAGGLLQQIIPGLGGGQRQPTQTAPQPIPNGPIPQEQPTAPGSYGTDPSPLPDATQPQAPTGEPVQETPLEPGVPPPPTSQPLEPPSDQTIPQTPGAPASVEPEIVPSEPSAEPGAAPLAPQEQPQQTAPAPEPAPAPAPTSPPKQKKKQPTIPGTNIPLPF